MGNGLLNSLNGNNGNRGGGGDSTMLIVVGLCIVCCCCSSSSLVGSYFLLPGFKDWVNNLFGQGSSGPYLSGVSGKGCLDTYTLDKQKNNNGNACLKNGKKETDRNLTDIKDVDGVKRGCPAQTFWNAEGTLCCLSDGTKCRNAGTAFPDGWLAAGTGAVDPLAELKKEFPHWGWNEGTAKHAGLLCTNNNNTGCNTHYVGGVLVKR